MSGEGVEQVIDREQLTDLAIAALRRGGLPQADAEDTATVLVLAEMLGIRTHGVLRVTEYLGRAASGGVDPAPQIEVERVAPSLARLDAANGLGPVAGMRALRTAMELARETGMGAVFVRGSNHFGPIMPYSYLAAESGFASIIGSNATTTIAPWGGTEAKLGNSPFAIGVPRPGDDPVILDIAMSVVARAKIRRAAREGQSIPDTWATDAAGRPTTDPNEALQGFLLPVGGHKGYGLALMVDMFAGVLSGAAYLSHVSDWSKHPERAQDLGHFFILIDTTRLGSAPWLAERVNDFAAILHDTPPVDPAQPVRLPGEFELAAMRKQAAEGITVDSAILSELRRLAGEA